MTSGAKQLNASASLVARALAKLTSLRVCDSVCPVPLTVRGKTEPGRQIVKWGQLESSPSRPALLSELGIQRDGVVLLALDAQGHEAPLFWERA